MVMMMMMMFLKSLNMHWIFKLYISYPFYKFILTVTNLRNANCFTKFPEEPLPLAADRLVKNPAFGQEVHLVCFVVDIQKLQVQKEDETLMDLFQATKKAIRMKG